MTIEALRHFLLWCTILNFITLLGSTISLVVAGDHIYKIHSKFFHISREAFDNMSYGYLGLYKVLFTIFNVIPYLVLLQH